MAENQQHAALLPLRGLRFHDDLARVIGPPADIDSSDAARAFVSARPHSAVRLEIADDADDARFTVARRLLSDWERSGVLRLEDRAAYYVYEQGFDDLGVRRARRGIFGLTPLGVPEVCVLPHEDTWEDNLARRVRLLRDLRATLSPIFLLYDGPPTVSALLDELTRRAPDADADDEFGETHRLWVVDEPAQVERVAAAVQGLHFVIADGHHRYAAARIFHEEHGDDAAAVILACCVEASDPGIVIRPIHRLLLTLPRTLDDALPDLCRWFDIETRAVEATSGWELVAALGNASLPRIGLLATGGERLHVLTLRDWDAVAALLPQDVVEPVRALDVTVATALILEHALGFSADEHADALAYTNDPNDALAATRAGQAHGALLLRPPRLDQVLAVARAGGRMPPKSTSFVPKLPIGLVMHDFASAVTPD